MIYLEEHDVQYAQDTMQQMGGDIVVVFQDDNETSKIERQAELEKKRQVFFKYLCLITFI